ncbi:hypothetical protein BaRGS_00001832 [Batillaria attramentaria]|uniref:CUB domain-containing protein n=1 Tax=Batillaria attramentaria TaxID=370345 RepID=A0ABD0M5D3_9CAEN
MPTRNPFSLLSLLAVLTLSVAIGVQGQCYPSAPENLTAISEQSQDIFSPDYPRNYPNNADCQWHISTRPGYVIQLNVVSIDLELVETVPTCTLDFIEVFDGSSDEQRRIIKFCAYPERTPDLMSSGQDMLVRFTSDFYVTGNGFHLSYKAVQYYLYQQYITSPGYPDNYPDNSNCAWRIQTPFSYYVVQLHVLSSDFEMEYSPGCRNDNITVYNAGTVRPTTTASWDRDINTGALLGGLISGVVIFVTVCLVCCYTAHSRRASSLCARPPAATTNTTPYPLPSAPTVHRNNPVYIMSTSHDGSPQSMYYNYPGVVAGTTNAAYSPSADGPPSYWSLQHGSSLNVTPSEPVSPTVSSTLPAPPSYTDAMKATNPPVIPVQE